jgi:ATP-dependent DNA helicase PIF1
MSLTIDQQHLMDCMLTGRHGSRLLCFGAAGTGKSFLINQIVNCFGSTVLAAPTGRAATIIGGSTIHKLFGIPSTQPVNPDFNSRPVHVQRFNDPACRYFGGGRRDVLRHCSWIILDEIGMVRCDHLDFIEAALRNARRCSEPFGGAKILLIGDIGQLPPVANGPDAEILKRYGYSAPFGLYQSNALKHGFHVANLTKVIRQKNPIEANILNRIRSGTQTKIDIDYLNTRVKTPDSKAVVLTPLRKIRDEINRQKLSDLSGKAFCFQATRTGTFKKKNEKDLPIEEKIVLKDFCRVVVKANMTYKIKGVMQNIVNGDTGTFYGLDKRGRMIIHRDSDNSIVYLKAKKYQDSTPKVIVEDDKEKVVDESKGEYIQFPVQLGYSMTIHSSQGSTLNKVHIQLPRQVPMAPGLTYTALSRIKCFDDLTLSRELRMYDIWSDVSANTQQQQHEFEGLFK